MKSTAFFLLAVAEATASETNPIRKIVTLLQNMQKEVEEEGEKEEEMYKKFQCYCKHGKDSVAKENADAMAAAEAQKSAMEQAGAEKKQLEEELKQHKKDRADAKVDLAKAEKIREKEHAVYLEETKDFRDDVAAMDKAIKALEGGMGAAFLQTSAGSQLNRILSTSSFVENHLDNDDKETLVSFLAQSGDYVPQSGQIVGILKNMKDEMDKDLGGVLGDEEKAAKSFAELKAAKQKEIAAASEAIEAKTARVGELAVAQVNAKNAAEDASEDAAEAEKFAAQLAKNCSGKDKEMEERQKTRAEEVEAINQAILVLNDDDALETFSDNKTLNKKALVQTAFLQTKALKNNVLKVKNQLKNAKFDSPALNMKVHTILAQIRVEEKSGKVDFSKVLKMIDDMVVLLEKETKTDEESNAMCVQQLDEADDEEKETERTIKQLKSAIAETKDTIESLAEDIKTGKANIAALDKSVAEATEQRKEEHSAYISEKEMNDQAKGLIEKAKNKLNKFYNPGQFVGPKKRQMTREEELAVAAGGAKPDLTKNADGSPVVLLQLSSKQRPEAPKVFESKTYEDKGQKANSVIALMDMMIKDVDKALTEGESEEKDGQEDYEKLMADSQEKRASEVKSLTEKEKQKAELGTNLEEKKSEHTAKADQLMTVQKLIQDLHAKCDFIMQNLTVRKEKRSNEIEGLKNAKAVLSGANYSL